MSNTTIAIDAMGGDYGPAVTIAGLAVTLSARSEVGFLLYGNEDQINAELHKHKALAAVSTVIHCDVDVPMDAKPSLALRKGRKVSGMWRAFGRLKRARPKPAYRRAIQAL